MDYKSIIERNRENYLESLFEVIRQKSISAENEGIEECAELVAEKMSEAGVGHVEIIKGAHHPVVYGEHIVSEDAMTLLIYGHYDVQPPDPVEEWDSEPFEPVIRDGRIYARGVGDNKGQFMAQILAFRTYMEAHGNTPINIKFIIEGEEEVGSRNLEPFIHKHKDKLKADLVYTSDGPMLSNGHPYILLGVRGMLYVELNAEGSAFDNHSGNKGNIARNPVWELVHLLGTMKDADGRVLIDGFYDEVKPPTDLEKELLMQLPFDLEEIRKEIGDDSLEMTKEEYYQKLCFEPVLNISGLVSGYGGEGAKTIIPSTAKLKLDMRLVMDQNPERIYELLEAHVEKHAPGVRMKRIGMMHPSRTSAEHPYIEPLRRAVEKGFGKKAYIQPSMGGSLPDAVWTKILGAPSVVVPYANADEANHSPNENLVVENFYNGIASTCMAIDALNEL
ncbi:M20/M25/M40 family metallo-hydrolase [Salinicoccus kekensis]|uniref:Acetylornithine deacetylase/succinyl-diaminopimelate desuccinylase-like protein n=1 Tax=Salinicoccus kekensis TaxID=714307 RepID=A0A285UJ72_9STAP|nr:M20/M25/M40 family metallo-hydrolase [Salinicoccus kekensis]SOC41954.1 acetylornithine deacetylase/succinyl-diaminopimelate desuccinylase-like protein [Salinicoccus kekensis]